jgi:hypothetical protein
MKAAIFGGIMTPFHWSKTLAPRSSIRALALPQPLLWALDALVWAALLAVALLALGYHAQLCTFPYQLFPSEGGVLQSVRGLQAGLDPWSPAQAPEYFNTYGIGYPWLVQQLARLSGPVDLLLLMRLCTAGCLFFAAGMLYLALREGGAGLRVSLGACLAFYATVLYSDTQVARPDGLTVALYVLGVVWTLRPGRANALVPGALGAAAFFVKPQGLLTVPVAAALLWAQGRRRDAVASVAFALLVWAALAAAVLWLHPQYFEGTVLLQASTATFSLRHMLQQWQQLGLVHWPALAGAAVALAFAAYRRRPLSPQGPARLWGLAAGLAFAALACGPGGHTGAFLTYYNQLVLPFFFVFLALWLGQLGLDARLLALVLALDAGTATWYAMHSYPAPNAAQVQVWRRVDAWVSQHPFGFYPPIFTSVVVKDHAFLTDTDHSHCLVYARGLDGPSPLEAVYKERMTWIAEQMAQGRFQSVVCGGYWPCPEHMADLGYREVEPFYLNNGSFRFSVYVPKNTKEPQ